MDRRKRFSGARAVIVKVGSSLLANEDNQLDVKYIEKLCEQMCKLIATGTSVVLVSSGAVVAGMSRLKWKSRPAQLGDIQVAAAVGQMCLADTYAEAFARKGLHSAQVLLTAEDMSNRTLYLNSRTLLKRMCELGIVPVVNENDAVALEGLRFGDNDRLAAMVANLIETELLVLMTDQDGLLDASDRAVAEAPASDVSLRDLCRAGHSRHGSGGMQSKLDAALIAARGGTHTVIMNGKKPEKVLSVAEGEQVGTLLYPKEAKLSARKRWVALGLSICGKVEVDAGAAEAIIANGKSLLPIGVRKASGNFRRGDVIECLTPDGQPIAQGLSSFNSDEVSLILGKPSKELKDILGYDVEPELIHRDNMAILRQHESE